MEFREAFHFLAEKHLRGQKISLLFALQMRKSRPRIPKLIDQYKLYSIAFYGCLYLLIIHRCYLATIKHWAQIGSARKINHKFALFVCVLGALACSSATFSHPG